MNQELASRIVNRLINDYEFKENGDYLQQGRCPSCNKKELFANKISPWSMKCGRENNCGEVFKVRDLYPNEFGNFNKRFQATEKNQNATADAYLTYERGFDLKKCQGWYTQGKYWHPKGDKGTATVRFDIDRINDVYMERLIEPVHIAGESKPRKANFHGSHKGLWWQPVDIDDGDEIWITEGCLDAIALWQNGIKAVSILSSHNFPAKAFEEYKRKKVTWVWALDNDVAGRKWTLKHVKRSKDLGLYDVKAAQAPGKDKCDWNDLHIAKKLTSSDVNDYLYYGDLLTANSALDKALIMWQKYPKSGFVLDFKRRMYWFDVDPDKYTKARERIEERLEKEGEFMDENKIRAEAVKTSGGLVELANCHPQFLYFQENTITDESWYYARVDFPHGGRPVKNTFTGGQVAGASEFKKRLLSIAPGALYQGKAHHLDWIIKNQLSNIKTVETIDFLGYSDRDEKKKIDHRCYVFPSIAFQEGKAYHINDEDYFNLPQLAIKSLYRAKNFTVADVHTYRDNWPQLLFKAFGPKGILAAVFWFGSLFAIQIREFARSYPFLEIVGKPGTGKTSLVETLWKLFGQDKEGIDPNKATAAGLNRTLAQFSNMPTVFIEADREETSHSRRFDWEETKPLYNGRGMGVRGQKNSGNETYDPPFRGTLCITQNDPVNASDPVLQRIVHLYFDEVHHSLEQRDAFNELMSLKIEQLSYFLQVAVCAESRVVESVKQKTASYENELMEHPEIKVRRLAKNHAQLAVLLEEFARLVHLTEDQLRETKSLIGQLAVERQQAIGKDHPVVAQFWETYDYINSSGEKPLLNHSNDLNRIAVNLNQYVELASSFKQQIPNLNDLKRHLKSSKSRKFVAASENVASAIKKRDSGAPVTTRCWIFENPTGRA